MMADVSYSITVETRINASAERVWAALTAETGAWWPTHFFATASAKSFVVQGRLGGLVYEDGGSGTGAIWGTVVVWLPDERKMTWACETYPGCGGPGRSFVTFEVIGVGPVSFVRLTDTGLVPDGPGAKASLESGWAELLAAVASYAENPSVSA